jgi:hypothetical protein
VSDEQIIEYLRSRAAAVPPPTLVASVMDAVDAAPSARSSFATFIPAVAVAAAVAIVALVALVIGPGQDMGPAPTPSVEPSVAASNVTLDELEAAVGAATERLASANAVHGSHTYEIDGYLASATWFDWRPGGDQVVVTREDIDVSASWWSNPGGEPLTVGERIGETISVITDGQYVFSRDESWIAPLEGPRGPLSWGTGMLSGDIPPLGGLDPETVTSVTRSQLAEGGETWSLRATSDGEPQLVEWTIDDFGLLTRYLAEGVGMPVALQAGLLVPLSTRTVIDFTSWDDTGPIPEPDLDGSADASLFGLPADFPLGPEESAAAIDYRAYLEDVMGVLEGYHWNSANVDWAAARSAALDGLPETPDAAQAHQRILNAIQTFDTFGTHFVRPQDVPSGSEDPDVTTFPEAELIGDVGYLWLPSYIGTDADALTAYVTTARAAIERVHVGAAIDAASPPPGDAAGTCGWVVDLRSTTGRSAVPLFASLAGHFDEGRVITYRSARGDWWLEREPDGDLVLVDERREDELGSPTFGSVLAGAGAQSRADAGALTQLAQPILEQGTPIAILTSPITAGPGEQVAIALRDRPPTRVFGGVTSGTPQEVLIVRLADGAELRMPTGTPLTADGTPGTANLVPDEIVADTGAGGDDPVLERAVDWLAEQAGCP